MDPIIKCNSCTNYYKQTTLNRTGGTCTRCVRKSEIVRDRCKTCNGIYQASTLVKRNGICYKCITHEENIRKVECKRCKQVFSYATLKRHNGYCATCFGKTSYLERSICSIIPSMAKAKISNNNSTEIIKFERLAEKTCSICLEDFQNTDDIRLLTGCKHFFHPNCISSLKECPLCRKPI